MHPSIFSDKLIMMTDIQEKGQSACRNFQYDQKCHKFDHMTFRTKQNQKVQRTCQIVGIQRNKIRSQSKIPGILQAAATDFTPKLGEKRTVLVIHINVQNTVVAKRIHTISNAYDHTNEKWQSKCSYIWKSFALRKTLHLIHYLFLSNKL